MVEITKAIRAVIPTTMPLFLRLSSTEWMEHSDLHKQLGSWDVDSTIRLSKVVADLGVDLLDVSSGGNHPEQRINMFNSKDYQIKIAARIRSEMKAAGKELLIGAVGLITEPEQARDILEVEKQEAEVAKEMTEGKDAMADVILVARQFSKSPATHETCVEILVTDSYHLVREPEWVLRVAWQLGVNIAWPSQFLRVRFPKL